MGKLTSYFEDIEEDALVPTMEAKVLEELRETSLDRKDMYILLTDTKTFFSRVSKMVTKDPYNHVSVMFDPNFEEIYTYALKTAKNGFKGGIKREYVEDLDGANYSLYKVSVTKDMYELVKKHVIELESRHDDTSYNHLALINTIFKRDVFNSAEDEAMICSQFVYEVLKLGGIQLFKGRSATSLRPYEFVRSKLLQFVKRGLVSKNKKMSVY